MNDSTMIPDLPDPWVFDGYRRIYDDGRPTSMWQARAVNPVTAETDEIGTKVDWAGGLGTTFEEARDALVDALAGQHPES